jgi:16S rRNA processing protein RimM
LTGIELLRIGRILGAHSLHGRLKVLMVSDFPERFNVGNTVYLGEEPACRKSIISGFQPVKGRECLLELEGLDDRDEALSLKGQTIYIDKVTAEETRELLDEDSYYYFDLIGCDVYFNGSRFGLVKSIFEAGAGDILIIESIRGEEVFIPFVESMVDTAGIREGRIEIHPPEGMIDSTGPSSGDEPGENGQA